MSSDLNGPWTYVAADELPDSFAKIPGDSSVGEVRTHIVGTPEANDAVLHAQVPTTVVVDRNQTIAVSYIGTPDFQPIAGTDLKYAVNTASPVIQTQDGYYSVDQVTGVNCPCRSATMIVAGCSQGY